MRTKAMDALDAARKYTEEKIVPFYYERALEVINRNAKRGWTNVYVEQSVRYPLTCEALNAVCLLLKADGFAASPTTIKRNFMSQYAIEVSWSNAYCDNKE